MHIGFVRMSLKKDMACSWKGCANMKEFEKIIGYEYVKQELYRICDIMRNPEKYRKLGVTTPKGLLLTGEPGVGKTQMCLCLVEASKRPCITVRKDRANGDFVNYIRNSFEKARNEAPSIVFLDDMDKFANEDEMHRDAEEYVTVQSCIDDCKNSEVFVLATTNSKYDLPDSLLRVGRFDKHISIEIPKGDDAIKIIDYYLKKKAVKVDVDAVEISRLIYGSSCAELETVVNEAGIYAAYDGRDAINREDFIKASLRTIFEAPEATCRNNMEYERVVAFHEAGHVVAAEIMNPGSVNMVSICKNYGSKEGITSISYPEEHEVLKTDLEKKVICRLAGKAAVEIVFGYADVGCNSDLCTAYEIVTNLVDDCCVYGFDTFEMHNTSDELLRNKERKIAMDMERFYQLAKQLLIDNKKLLQLVADSLLEKKTLTYNDIKKLVG